MIYIGTSGWSYKHWKNGVFYPQRWKEHELRYYQKFFNSVELNTSFYHLPKKEAFRNWRKLVPKDFIFSVKASRYLTHILKLSEPREPLENLLENASVLREKLGPIFFQFAPNFAADPEKLAKFAKILRGSPRGSNPPFGIRAEGWTLRFAFEFRHQSWFSPEIYQILKKHNLALIFSDTPKYPYEEEITADFIYLRLHGHKVLYGSKYTKEELRNWTRKIKRWGRKKDVYCYFDNDAQGFAPQNAIELKEILIGSS